MTISPGLTNISDLFGADRVFIIPPYQRPYSWEKDQVQDMLDDIRYTDPERTHFFGTILFKNSGIRCQSFDVVEVVDGQQRLTTLQILISECIRRLTGVMERTTSTRLTQQYLKVDRVPRLTPSSFDKSFYQDVIIGDQGYPNTPHTPSQDRLRMAKEQIRSYVDALSVEEGTRLLDQVKRMAVLVYTVASDGEASVIFETTNDRGKPLGTLDKTKSFLMQHLYSKGDNLADSLREVNDQFSVIYGMLDVLEDNGIASFGDDEVQRWHFILTYENWGSHKDYDNYLPFIKRAVNDVSRRPDSEGVVKDYVTRYVSTLVRTFTAVKELIEHARDKNDRAGKALIDFFVLGREATFMPMLIEGWIQARESNDMRSMVAFSLLTKSCEVCSFRAYGVGNRRSNTKQSALFSTAWRLHRKELTLVEATASIMDMVDELTPKNIFEEKLRSQSFWDEVPTGDIKFLLWKYEMYARERSQPIEPLSIPVSEVFSDKVEIEHILPQTNALPRELADRLVNCLGNLALASKSANASMSNKPFSEKSEYYKNSLFRTQRDLSTVAQWGEPEIAERTDTLVRFCLEHWDALNSNP